MAVLPGGSAQIINGGACLAKNAAATLSRPAGRPARPPVHDRLVRRDFTADRPNQVWLADSTEHPTSEGKRYVCAIKDADSNCIVGYSIDSRMQARIAVTALTNAVARRHGKLLQPAPKERPQPPNLDDPRRATPRNRHLDRIDLSPPQTTRSTRPIDTNRIRDDHDPNSQSGCLTNLTPKRASDPLFT